MSKYVYGIDLGTTYSCIAYQDENGKPIVVKNAEGANTTPSIISLAGDEPVVGEVAKENAVFDADFTLSFVKNKIGRKDSEGNPVMIYYDNGNKEISPTIVSSYTLKKLAEDAGKALDDEVQAVVITCPAYFNSEQKKQTKQAGIEAGLDVLSVIDEPTAAAICYGCDRDVEGQTFLVYDLGGGTFDITVMQVEGGKFKVVCSEGNHDLGGGLWDQAVYDYIESQYREQTGDEEEFEMDVIQDLTLKSEKAKQHLSGKPNTTVAVVTNNGRAKIEITKEIFDDITSTLLEETVNLTKKAIAVAQGFAKNDNGEEKSLDEILDDFDANFNPDKIDQILLVGGSTKMPQVEEKIKDVFKVKTTQYDPDEAVAKGAAIYACLALEDEINPELETYESESETTYGSEEAEEKRKTYAELQSKKPVQFQGETLSGRATDIVTTVTNKSYGIVVTSYNADYPDGYECISNLIIRDSELPRTETKTYTLASDAQESIWIRLCESNSRDENTEFKEELVVFDNEYDIPKGLSKSTAVDIEMELQKDGILNIKISVAGTVMTDTHKVDVENN